MNDTKYLFIKALQDSTGTPKEMSKRFRVTPNHARVILRRLLEEKLIKQIAYGVYLATARGRKAIEKSEQKRARAI